jgi:hypothetical protein
MPDQQLFDFDLPNPFDSDLPSLSFELTDYLTQEEIAEEQRVQFEKLRSELVRTNYRIYRPELIILRGRYKKYIFTLKQFKNTYQKLENQKINGRKRSKRSLSPNVDSRDILDKLRQSNRRSSRTFRTKEKERKKFLEIRLIQLKEINKQFKKIYAVNEKIINIQKKLIT